MEFQLLKKSHLKRNIIIGVVVVAIISAVVLNFTRAKYVYTDKMPLINGTVNYSLADLNIVAIYVGGAEVDSLDSSKQYTLDTTQSTCTYKDGSTIEGLNISYETETGSLSISPFTTKGTKCMLYFDEYVPSITIQDILSGKTISTRTDFSTTVTEDTTGTIYRATDDDGTTYYFAGNPTDNWVYFAGFYWRIIRVNGDGSIRLIYNGTSNATTGRTTQLSDRSAFNSSYNDNAYVGFKYGNGGASSYSETHANTHNSTILNALNTWYSNNIENAGYSENVDMNAGFCGDRTSYIRSDSGPYTYTSGGGIGTTVTYYGTHTRLDTANRAAVNPSFRCANDNDLYTVSSSNKGNQVLTYPVGLITADEVAYAGGVAGAGNSNSSYYLYTNQYYFTMSPYSFNALGYALVYIVLESGIVWFYYVNDSAGVRPVINLRADTLFVEGGTGTATNPYVLTN